MQLLNSLKPHVFFFFFRWVGTINVWLFYHYLGDLVFLHESYLPQNGQKYILITNPNYGGAAGRLQKFTLHL